jgi:hypothetical protein
MPDRTETALQKLDPAQATDLSQLVELEARWENLRKPLSRSQEEGPFRQTLLGVQKAYDVFRIKLAAYNKRHKPAHMPELLLNTPSRLALWCRAMRQLYLQVEHDPQAQCPLQLLEKAYRCADRMSLRLNKDPVSRPEPPGTIRGAIEHLGALVQWCDDLASGGAQPVTPEVATDPSGVPTRPAHSE